MTHREAKSIARHLGFASLKAASGGTFLPYGGWTLQHLIWPGSPRREVSRVLGTLVSDYDPRWSVLILFFYHIDSRCSSRAMTTY